MKRIKPEKKIIAQLVLSGCPEGDVLNGKPNPEVGVFFEGWTNALTPHAYWNMPSNMRVIHEGGKPVLEHPTRDDRCLMVGEPSWRDYTIESNLKIMSDETVKQRPLPTVTDEKSSICPKSICPIKSFTAGAAGAERQTYAATRGMSLSSSLAA